jgi:hypothetical protein
MYLGCMWLQTGYGFDIGFIEHLYTPLRTTGSYSTTTNLHTLQFTTAPTKLFPACHVFTSRSLATASSSGDSSASHVQAPPLPTHSELPASYSLDWTGSLSLLSLSCRAQLHSAQHYQPSALFFYNHFARTEQKTSFTTIHLLLLAYLLLWKLVYRSIA